MERIIKGQYVVLCGCLFLIAQSLIFGLKRSITLDEATTLFHCFQGFHFTLAEAFNDIHTSAYNVFLGIWLSIFKFDLVWAKLFSVGCAVLALVATYFFAKRALGLRIAIYAVIILAFSPLFIFYSQYVRSYALFSLAAILSGYFFLSLESDRSRKNSIFYVLATYLMICSHVVAITVLCVQWIHFGAGLIKSRDYRRVRPWLLMQLIICILYFPVVYAVLNRFNLLTDIPKIYSWVPMPGILDLIQSFSYLSGSATILSVLIWALVMFGIISVAFSIGLNRNISYLILWLLLPNIFLYLYSHLHHPLPILHGIASGIVPLAILAALAITQLLNSRTLRVLVLACILAISVFESYQQFAVQLEAWAEASASIQAARKNNPASDLVLVHPSYSWIPLSYYLQRDCFYSQNFTECLNRAGIFPVESMEEIDSHLKTKSIIWFVGYKLVSNQNFEMLEELKKSKNIQLKGLRLDLPSVELWQFSVPASL